MKNLKIFALLLVMAMLLGVLAGCSGEAADDTGSDGGAKLTVVLVLEDGTEESHEITFTAGSTLREALYQGGLIEEDQLAELFLITISGHSADWNEGLTWMICDENGDQISGFVDEILPEDGQTIRLVYTVVPDFD